MQITEASHLDHGLTESHKEWLRDHFADRSEFFIETVRMPDVLLSLECGLYGPIMGDGPVDERDVRYAVRNNRKWSTRVARRESMRMTRLMTVVAGPHDGLPCVLFTAYGGPPAPREPGDPSLATLEQIQESREFWSKHALVIDEELDEVVNVPGMVDRLACFASTRGLPAEFITECEEALMVASLEVVRAETNGGFIRCAQAAEYRARMCYRIARTVREVYAQFAAQCEARLATQTV